MPGFAFGQNLLGNVPFGNSQASQILKGTNFGLGSGFAGFGATPSAAPPAPVPSTPAAPPAASPVPAPPLAAATPAAPVPAADGWASGAGLGAPANPFVEAWQDAYGGSGPVASGGIGNGGIGQPKANNVDTLLKNLYATIFPGQAGALSVSDLGGILPGRNENVDALFSLLLNMAYGQVQQQGPRSAQAEGLYKGFAEQGPQSAPYLAAMDAAGAARDRIDPSTLAAYEESLRTRAAQDAGAGYQNTIQRMRDAGLLGRGGMSVDPALAASSYANDQLARQNLDISGLMEQLASNRLAQAGQLGQQGAGVWQNLGMVPGLNYAQMLQQNPNAAMPAFQELLNQIAQAGLTGEIAHRNAPSGFEKIGAPILGGVLGGASGIGDLVESIGNIFG